MDQTRLNERIVQRGKEFFEQISGESPSIFKKSWWTGKVMDWSMKDEDFKVQMFRFVDVMPYLTTTRSLTRHIQEYFESPSGELPAAMRYGLGSAKAAGWLGQNIMSFGIRYNIRRMGRMFIVGQKAKEAIKTLTGLRKNGFAFVLDVLGEATVSESESETRLKEHLDLLDAVAKAQHRWPAHGGGELDWGHAPVTNLAVKPSAFFSQARPSDFEGSVEGIYNRLAQVYRRIIQIGGFMCIDMEHHALKDITIEVFKRLRSDEEFKDYPHLGLVFQAYLKETDHDLDQLLTWARDLGLPISIRLVKGAYWDYEAVKAKQNGWPVPVYTVKAETDAAYERLARKILENSDLCHFACASHNIRSIAAVMETALALKVPEDRYEFQVLYGMAEPIRKGLKNVARRVRLYAPYGELIPGMAYLVRRLLENTSNESFLRQSFVNEEDLSRLLEDPLETLKRQSQEDTPAGAAHPRDLFANEPMVDFTRLEAREAFPKAIAKVRAQLGATCPLMIGGRDVTTDDTIPSVNPADPDETIGQVCQAGTREVDEAIAAAKAALPAWSGLAPRERAEKLFKAADIARKNLYELAAWQVLEVGKQWDQAHADVGEAIDFLEYYGREAVRFGTPRRLGRAPGELNTYQYRPKGLAAVIAPWNFPLAISCGMTSAALAAGNCVLYKPSSLSSLIGHGLAQIYKQAGIPDGVFNFLPGRSSVMGDHLVEHPDIDLIAFTGSMEVGLHIVERAAIHQPGQNHIKKVIAEMGGKNAIVIDDDAELDEAVVHVLYSAFAFQGQKCSACSRVIVLREIYDKFVSRLVEGARSLALGPAEDPAHAMGPVVDKSAQEKILEYIALAEQEGRVLLKHMPSRQVAEKGFYVPLTIVEGITPEHRLAQEEIFGPVLAVMKAENFDQALIWANQTRYALTGSVFSRSPARLEEARRKFEVGNLYLNRNNTGALVERQPFGGFKLSGIGSKAGGPDYLLQFMDPVCITENTVRRGFAPIEEDDDWI